MKREIKYEFPVYDVTYDRFNVYCRKDIPKITKYFSNVKGVNEVVLHGSCLQQKRKPSDIDIWVWIEPTSEDKMKTIYKQAIKKFPRPKYDIIIEQDTDYNRMASTNVAGLSGVSIFKKQIFYRGSKW